MIKLDNLLYFEIEIDDPKIKYIFYLISRQQRNTDKTIGVLIVLPILSQKGWSVVV